MANAFHLTARDECEATRRKPKSAVWSKGLPSFLSFSLSLSSLCLLLLLGLLSPPRFFPRSLGTSSTCHRALTIQRAITNTPHAREREKKRKKLSSALEPPNIRRFFPLSSSLSSLPLLQKARAEGKKKDGKTPSFQPRPRREQDEGSGSEESSNISTMGVACSDDCLERLFFLLFPISSGLRLSSSALQSFPQIDKK